MNMKPPKSPGIYQIKTGQPVGVEKELFIIVIISILIILL